MAYSAIILSRSHAHTALDLERTLAPDVQVLSVDVVAQGAVVATRGLAAEQDFLQGYALDQVPCPDQHAPEAHRAVLERFIAQFLDSLLCVSDVNCACINFFFGNVDADYDFFHTFVPFLITGSD